MKALKERKRLESEMEISEPKKETKSRNKVGKITGRRKIPLRIKLRQQAASSKGEENEDKTNLLSVIVKGLSFLFFLILKLFSNWLHVT